MPTSFVIESMVILALRSKGRLARFAAKRRLTLRLNILLGVGLRARLLCALADDDHPRVDRRVVAAARTDRQDAIAHFQIGQRNDLWATVAALHKESIRVGVDDQRFAEA